MTQDEKSRVHLELDNLHAQNSSSISYSTLVAIFVSLIVGAVIVLIAIKVVGASVETFTTSELLSFLFAVVLSAASIVLAITAISLGKASERAMIERSDESIRLQTEVFAKTTEALQRIESSTGVTEKRIEDIISGRAGAISDRVVDRLIEERSVKTKSRKALEMDVRQSVMQALSTEAKGKESEQEREAAKRIVEDRAKFQKFTDDVLQHMGNYPDVHARKLGQGSFLGEGEDLCDGVFDINKRRIGVCTFMTKGYLPSYENELFEYFFKLSKEIAKGTFEEVLLVFDDVVPEDSVFHKALHTLKDLAKEELFSKLIMLGGKPEDVNKRLDDQIIQRK